MKLKHFLLDMGTGSSIRMALFFWQLIGMTSTLLATGSLCQDTPTPVAIQTEMQRYWLPDPDEAFQKAASENRCLVIAFVGIPWCPWSRKMEQEILSKEHFAAAIAKEMVPLRINFPERGSVPEKSIALRDKYDIQEFPTVILADPKGEEIAKIGYLPINEEEFANLLIGKIEDYKELETVFKTEVSPNFSIEELRALYKKAVAFPKRPYRTKLLQLGLSKEKSSAYFLLEKYAFLIEKGKRTRDPEIQRVRKDIIDRDPENGEGSLLRLALLDFQFLCKKLRKRDDPASAVGPLVEYVKNHGSKDRENLWKVHMMISQYLFAKGRVKEAVAAAEASLETAPAESKDEIAQTIDVLKGSDLYPR